MYRTGVTAMSITLYVTAQPTKSRDFSNSQFLWAMDALGISYEEGITSALLPSSVASACKCFWQDWGYASPEQWSELLVRRSSPGVQKALSRLSVEVSTVEKSNFELRSELEGHIRTIGNLAKHAIKSGSTLSLS